MEDMNYFCLLVAYISHDSVNGYHFHMAGLRQSLLMNKANLAYFLTTMFSLLVHFE